MWLRNDSHEKMRDGDIAAALLHSWFCAALSLVFRQDSGVCRAGIADSERVKAIECFSPKLMTCSLPL